jgi:hypothetical protein
VLTELPRHVDQRVDTAALERLAADLPAGKPPSDEYEQATGLEADLVGLWRRTLNRDDVTSQTDFFTHGGFSLLAAKLVQDLEQLTGVRLQLPEFFAHPTPAALAAYLSGSKS